MSRLLAAAAVLAVLVPLSFAAPLRTASASDFDVIINEIHYNPLSGDDREEFVELFNRGGTAVDLGGWTFSEGIHLTIAEGTTIAPGAFILVTPDAALAAARHGAGVEVIGDWTGRLDNGGEIVALRNDRGDLIGRVHFGDGGQWPATPDGLGPSLEVIDPFARLDLSDNWAASILAGGTPGAPNSVLAGRGPGGGIEEIVLVPDDAVWRYTKGTAAYPQGWQEPGFSDEAWESGPTGIGYSDNDDRTVLDDMRNGYISFAARRSFDVTAETLGRIDELVLEVDYDDGFAAWLNGEEIARANLGAAGSAVRFSAPADAHHEAGSPESWRVPASLLLPGTNVLAVELHNAAIDSGVASFIPKLAGRPSIRPAGTAGGRAAVVINEIKGTEAGPGFIELFNRSEDTIDLGGAQIIDSRGNAFSIPPSTAIESGARVVFADSALGFDLQLAGVTYALLEADGATFIDGLDPRPGLPGAHGFSFGRVPDGDADGFVMREPSPGQPNTVRLESAIAINEIMFHPPPVPPGPTCPESCSDPEQWIEIVNRGGDSVDLAGWTVSNAVGFTFPAGTTIPAGGFLVVAASRQRFLEAHPGVDPAIVLGDWRRSLSHDSETINLRDPLGNRADHVKYGDGKPLNDESPADGIDDETFRGSEWPAGADGSGRTLELVHPALDNRHGRAWRAGPDGGTPGRANAAFDPSPPPVIGSVLHSPAIPRPGDSVTVTCRVSGASPIASVRALWHRDGGGPSGAVELRDDGLSGDGEAGDGRFGGSIPAQPDLAVVAFRIEAETGDGTAATAPTPPRRSPYGGFDGPFFLYQVIAGEPPANPSPSYYVVMTSADLSELRSRSRFSDVLLPCTFIARDRDGDVIRYGAGIRYRGSQSRRNSPPPYRIEFPPERPFRGIAKLDLNSRRPDTELLASDLFIRAGLPAPQVWSVNLTVQGDTRTRYVRKEHIDGSFLTRFFGSASDDGDLYRALDPDGDPREGDLTYFGEADDDYRVVYAKRTHKEEDDYSDIIELCRTFDRTETPDDVFPERLEAIVDVWQWARFFAVQACLVNTDGGIQTTSGEDYLLYKVPADSPRPDAGKWILIPWDIEETYGDASEVLFRPRIAAIRRFLTHPRYAPFYYCNILDLRQGVFSRRETRRRFRLIDFLFGFSRIDEIDRFITARIGFFDENIPVRLSHGTEDGAAAAPRLVGLGGPWTYFKGTREPSGGSTAWTAVDFDDSAWPTGAAGFGYGDGDDTTVLSDMRGGYTTVYIRTTFPVQNAAAIGGLALSMDYDDGFVAYLNGVEVARREAPGAAGTPVPFDATAAGGHEAGQPETIDISSGPLRDGLNVLAIQGLNVGRSSSDFSLAPELVSTLATDAAGCGGVVYTTSGEVALGGRANACDTREVLVGGQPAEYDTVTAQWRAIVAPDPGTNTYTIEARNGIGEVAETLEITVERASEPLRRIGGAMTEDLTLTPGAPYLLASDLVIPEGLSLSIEAGTTIYGSQDASIIVRGALAARGTAEAPIVIRARSCAGRWGGIHILGTGTSGGSPTHELRFCDLEGGDNPPGAGGFVAAENAKILVVGCRFADLTANAVDGTNARLEVRDSLFEHIQEGVHAAASTVIVSGCTFDGMVGDKDAIDFDGDGPQRSLIENCLIMNGSDDGIDLGRTSVDIRGNVFVNIQDKALSLESNGRLGPPTVTGNMIYDCGTGIALKNGVTVREGSHNTVVGNQEGISLFAKAGASDGGHGVFDSTIVWSNSVDVKLDSLSTVSFTYSDVGGGPPWPGEGNIAVDPLLADVAGLDFSLRAGSPCIGTGRDGSDIGAVPFEGDPAEFIRGDFDASGVVDLTDVIAELRYIFGGGAAPVCLDRGDANDDGRVDISDAVRSLLFQFAGAPPLPPPFPEPGIDPTADGIRCAP